MTDDRLPTDFWLKAHIRRLSIEGIPVAVREGEGKRERLLIEAAPEEEQQIRTALVRRRVPPLVRI